MSRNWSINKIMIPGNQLPDYIHVLTRHSKNGTGREKKCFTN